MLLHTAKTQVIDDAATKPLIWPDAEDVISTRVQVGLQSG